MQKFIQLTLLASLYTLSWSGASIAKPVEEEIAETGILRVGIRNDSPLFGYGEKQEGYCRDFAKVLATSLSEKLGKPVETELVVSTTQNRWELVQNGAVHLECGPNTITPERETEYKIKFSRPFFVTSTQIFVKSKITEEDFKQGTIGTIAGTTNAAEIQQVYPESQIKDTFTNRVEGVEAVQASEITGFASDGILLMGTATIMGLDANTFAVATPLVDGRPFCASYGMILPGNEENAPWRETVEKLIANNGQGAGIWDMWFAPLEPYINKTLAECHSNNTNLPTSTAPMAP